VSPDAATIVWRSAIPAPAADDIEAIGWAMIADKTTSG
jgi:hypothetical protein